ncbi:MAG: LacI family DNA-binding transcriptional regulator [Actinobacteria bacterium]|nr:LacI family DNA-binding transcriptional regulator [Actinomycetota bacterium]
MSSIEKRKHKQITIKHIAREAGFSFSTVAKALRNDPVVRLDTRQKILDAARKLNYYPNLMAKTLRSRKSKTIGIILNDLTNPLYYETIEEIEKKLKKSGYTMILSDSNFDLSIERENLITMLSKNADGIIFSPVSSSSDNMEIIFTNGINTVFIDAKPDNDRINYVYIDHQMASFLATEYLIDNGHKDILLFNGPKYLSSSDEFLKGYRKALEKNNIEMDESLLLWGDISIEKSYNKFLDLYHDKDSIPFSAVICLSDLMAIGIYKAARELGLHIPENLSVIGYDNIFVSEFLNPPLTTIHAPKKRVGLKAVEILLSRIENENGGYTKIELKPRLFVRESVSRFSK